MKESLSGRGGDLTHPFTTTAGQNLIQSMYKVARGRKKVAYNKRHGRRSDGTNGGVDPFSSLSLRPVEAHLLPACAAGWGPRKKASSPLCIRVIIADHRRSATLSLPSTEVISVLVVKDGSKRTHPDSAAKKVQSYNNISP